MDALECDAAAQKIIEECNAFGMAVTEDQASLLTRHLDLVIEKNKHVNLTRITSVADGVILHIIDSLRIVHVAGNVYKRAIDVGTGAGFPGIPAAIMSNASITLLDATRKKCDALNEFVVELGLCNCEVVNARAEEHALKAKCNYDIVFARAVAQGPTLIEYAAPLLTMGGRFVLAKAKLSAEESAATDRAASICGMQNVSRETFELPNSMGKRTIHIYEKTGAPSIKLPRRAGLAQHQPLA